MNNKVLITIVFVPFLLGVQAFAQQQMYAGQPWTPPKSYKATPAQWTPPKAFNVPQKTWAPPKTYKGESKPWTPPKGFEQNKINSWQPPKEFREKMSVPAGSKVDTGKMTKPQEGQKLVPGGTSGGKAAPDVKAPEGKSNIPGQRKDMPDYPDKRQTIPGKSVPKPNVPRSPKPIPPPISPITSPNLSDPTLIKR